MRCPNCGSHKAIKNGYIHNGKAKCQCNDCRRQFVIKPQDIEIPQMTV